MRGSVSSKISTGAPPARISELRDRSVHRCCAKFRFESCAFCSRNSEDDHTKQQPHAGQSPYCFFPPLPPPPGTPSRMGQSADSLRAETNNSFARATNSACSAARFFASPKSFAKS